MHLHWICLIEIHLKHVFFSVSDSSLIIVSSLTIVSAMNDIDNSVRESSLFDQLHQHHTGPGVTLGGLHQTGVACDKGHGEHLQVHLYYMYIDVSTLSTVYSAITAWSHLNVIHQQREYVQKFVIQLIFICFIKKIGDNTEIDKHIKTQGILYCKVFISTQALGWELHAVYHICSTIQSNATKIERLIYPLPTEESWQGSWMGWFQQWPREEHGKS